MSKPVIVEASEPITDKNANEIAAWCGGRVVREVKASDNTDVSLCILVPSLEGLRTGHFVLRASRGDRILRGPTGEFHPVKSDVFNDTYERLVEDA